MVARFKKSFFGIFAKQSSFFFECGFSVNKLTIDDNMQEKSVVSQLTFTIA